MRMRERKGEERENKKGWEKERDRGWEGEREYPASMWDLIRGLNEILSLPSVSFYYFLSFPSSVFQHILSPRVERINVLCIISLDRDAKKLGETVNTAGICAPSTPLWHQELDSELPEQNRAFSKCILLSSKYTKLSSSYYFSEQFADSCGIAHLRQCFAELKELVRACLHPDLQQMADNVNLRRSLFPRLDPLRLAALLEKVGRTTDDF